MGMIKDPTSWRVGFELGLAGFSFPYSKPRKPTAYLYNGIRLPALPEWDRGVYPYAEISYNTIAKRYRLTAWAAKPYCAGNFALFAPEGEGDIAHLSCWVSADNSGWDGFASGVLSDNGAGSSDKPFWSDWDVLDENGNVWLAASDPVPIYE